MENETLLILSDKLLNLLKERRENKNQKNAFVKAQKYEDAAKARDVEKKIHSKILNFLEEEFKYDFAKSKQVEKDMIHLLDLVEEGDEDFTNAINKLSTVDIERLKLMKDIEEYNSKKITLDDLHNRIKLSFHSVRQDLKNEILKLK